MLITLSNSVADLDLSADPANCDALDNILSAGFEGKNIVLASRGVIASLLEHQSEFSRKSVAYLSHLRSSYSEVHSIEMLLDAKVIAEPLQHHIARRNRDFVVPLSVFGDRSVSDAVVLVCENLIDCRLYEHAAIHYSHSRRIKGLKLAIDKRHGGGSTTGQVLLSLARERQRICLCIVDSDRISPTSAVGDTARACIDVESSEGWIIAVTVISEREGENAIPLGLLLTTQTGPSLERVLEFQQLTRHPGSQMHRYADLKGGTFLKWVFTKTAPGSP